MKWATSGTTIRNTCQVFKTILNTTMGITYSCRGCNVLTAVVEYCFSTDYKSLVLRLRWFESKPPYVSWLSLRHYSSRVMAVQTSSRYQNLAQDPNGGTIPVSESCSWPTIFLPICRHGTQMGQQYSVCFVLTTFDPYVMLSPQNQVVKYLKP